MLTSATRDRDEKFFFLNVFIGSREFYFEKRRRFFIDGGGQLREI